MSLSFIVFFRLFFLEVCPHFCTRSPPKRQIISRKSGGQISNTKIPRFNGSFQEIPTCCWVYVDPWLLIKLQCRLFFSRLIRRRGDGGWTRLQDQVAHCTAEQTLLHRRPPGQTLRYTRTLISPDVTCCFWVFLKSLSAKVWECRAFKSPTRKPTLPLYSTFHPPFFRRRRRKSCWALFYCCDGNFHILFRIRHLPPLLQLYEAFLRMPTALLFPKKSLMREKRHLSSWPTLGDNNRTVACVGLP